MAREYPIDVKIDPRHAQSGSQQVRGALKGIQRDALGLQRLLLQVFGAAAITRGVRRSVTILADFSQAMSTVKAVTQATDDQFRRLDQTAQRLGRSTRFSASQVADGMTFLARAGFEADEVMQSIEGTLQLAQAGALDLASAADIASNVLQGFRLETSDTARVVDVLALAANSSNTNVRQLGDAMTYAAPIAASLGISIEEATASVSALSDAGIQAERAGTGLRQIMIELANAGYDLSDSSGGIVGALQQLSKEMGTLDSDTERLALATELVKKRQAASLLVMIDSVDKIDNLTDAYDRADGTAARVAETMDDNLNGAFLAARSAIEGFVIAMGDAGATDALILFANALATGFRFAADNAEVLTVILVALAVKGIGGFLVSSKVMRAATLSMAANFIFLQTTAGTAAAVMGTLTAATRALAGSMLALALNPVVLGVAAIAAAFVLMRRSAKDARDEIDRVQGTMDKFKSVNADIERDTALLKTRNEELAGAIIATGTAAEAAATLEIESISRRLRENKKLKDSYKALIDVQIGNAERALRKNSLKDFKLAGFQTKSEGLGHVTTRRSTDEEVFNRVEEHHARVQKAIRERQAAGKDITRSQEKHLENYAKFKENEADLLNKIEQRKALNEAIADEASAADGRGSGGGNKVAADFSDELALLKQQTEALALNERARERLNAEIEFTRKLERQLTADEKKLVRTEIAKQQLLKDRVVYQNRIKDMEREVELLGLTEIEARVRSQTLRLEDELLGNVSASQRERVENLAREAIALQDAKNFNERIQSMRDENSLLRMNQRDAEVRAELLNQESRLLGSLSPEQAARVTSLVRENQALRDNKIIDDRLRAMDDEARLAGLVGDELAVMTDVLNLENQLQRRLTDTEREWVENAVRYNAELARRSDILNEVRDPMREAIQRQETINNLYKEGALTLSEYNSLLASNDNANAVRGLDEDLTSAGFDVGGDAAYEQLRKDIERQLRDAEGGGFDDGTDQTAFGFDGQDLGTQSELDRIREETQQRIDLIREARDRELLTEEEFARRKEAILSESQRRSSEAMMQGLDLQLSAAQNMFGSLTDIARNTAGEQSAIYKGMFAVEKAIAIARSIVKIQEGIAQAASLPFPANLGAMASVAAATASIVSNIQATRLNFRDGGVPSPGPGLIGGKGGPRTDSNLIYVSRGEGILNAEAVRKNLGLFHALNDDPDYLNRQLGVFRDGGVPGQAARAAIRSPRSQQVSSGISVRIGQVSVQLPDSVKDDPEGVGSRAGQAAAKAVVEGIIAEHLRPNGMIKNAMGGR